MPAWIDTAQDQKFKVGVYRTAHFLASDHLRIAHYILGVLLIAVSAVVSGSVLQATDGNPTSTQTLIAGSLATLVVILTAIQTTFKLGERGEQHKSAGAAFGEIERKLDIFIHQPHPDEEKAWEELRQLEDKITDVEAGAPGFLGHTYRAAEKKEEDELKSAAAGRAHLVQG